jgi:hypothetical protein
MQSLGLLHAVHAVHSELHPNHSSSSLHHDTHDQHRSAGWKSTSNCCEREEGHVDRLVMAVVVGSEEGRTSAGERLSPQRKLHGCAVELLLKILTFVSCVCKFVVDASRDTLSLVSVRHTLGSRSHGRGSSHLHMNNDSGVGCVCVCARVREQ